MLPNVSYSLDICWSFVSYYPSVYIITSEPLHPVLFVHIDHFVHFEFLSCRYVASQFILSWHSDTLGTFSYYTIYQLVMTFLALLKECQSAKTTIATKRHLHFFT